MRFIKGLIHLSLAVAALYEERTSETKERSLLLGACAGYHAQATLYHWLFEKENDNVNG